MAASNKHKSNSDVDDGNAQLQTAADDELGILLIGETGSGKSALGNSILWRKKFKSLGGFQAVTKSHLLGTTTIRGHTVSVVDTPGLNDTDLTTNVERLNLVIDQVKNAQLQTAADDELGILLIGETGSGKSALGNSILWRKKFKSLGGFQAVTKSHLLGTTTIRGHTVSVVDTPGLNDTDLTTNVERLNLVIDQVTNALAYFPNGFHAVVPVIPYIRRMVDETKQTIDTMVALLGADALESHGVMAISYGDSFQFDHGRKDDAMFKSWIESSEPRFQWIHKFCKGRCVLFDNVTSDKDEQNCQREKLVELVEKLGTHERYIPDICKVDVDKRASAIRDKLKLTKYVKGVKALDIMISKIHDSVIDNPPLTEESEWILKHEAGTLIEMLKTDDVFGSKALVTFSTKMGRLNRRTDTKTIANDMIQEINALQLKIDAKIKSTIYWKDLRRRVRTFFHKVYKPCEVL